MHRLLALEWPSDLEASGSARADNAWYRAHERAKETGAYLQDIRLAWQLAEAGTNMRLAQGEPAPSIGLEARYGLISASIVSMAGGFPTALLVSLVDQGVWTSAQALTYARENPSPGARVQALAALAPHLPASEQSAVAADALAAAGTIVDGKERAQTTTAMAQSSGKASLPWDPHWRAALRAAATQGRANVAAVLDAANDVIAHSGGVAAVKVSIQALRDVERWWP